MKKCSVAKFPPVLTSSSMSHKYTTLKPLTFEETISLQHGVCCETLDATYHKPPVLKQCLGGF